MISKELFFYLTELNDTKCEDIFSSSKDITLNVYKRYLSISIMNEIRYCISFFFVSSCNSYFLLGDIKCHLQLTFLFSSHRISYCVLWSSAIFLSYEHGTFTRFDIDDTVDIIRKKTQHLYWKSLFSFSFHFSYSDNF